MKQILDTKTLISLLERKDNKAYQYLYERYYVSLKALANYYLRDNVQGEDLVQDVFVALWESRYKFRTENEIKYFLYRALKNGCVSLLRKQKLKAKYLHEALSANVEEDNFWEKVLEEDVYARLMSAIETLPPQCKLVMQLMLEGLKGQEIAERLQISLATVKEYKGQGKKILQQQLKGRGTLLAIVLIIF